MKKFQYFLEYALVCVVRVILWPLPMPALSWTVKKIGSLAFYVLPKRRRIALANLDRVYHDSISSEEKKQIAKKSFQHIALAIGELFWIEKILPTQQKRFQFFGRRQSNWAPWEPWPKPRLLWPLDQP